jgi:hypothetical protein
MDQKLKPTEQKVETPIETPKDDGKKKLKKTKSDISEADTPKSIETPKEPESKPMSAIEKRKQDQLKLEGIFILFYIVVNYLIFVEEKRQKTEADKLAKQKLEDERKQKEQGNIEFCV